MVSLFPPSLRLVGVWVEFLKTCLGTQTRALNLHESSHCLFVFKYIYIAAVVGEEGSFTKQTHAVKSYNAAHTSIGYQSVMAHAS